MLDRTATYHKSDKGLEAIGKRAGGELSPRQRSMLILVDGRRSFAELSRLGSVLGDAHLLLAQLEVEGYIEPGEPRTGPPSAPAPLNSDFGGLDGATSRPAPLAPTALHVPLQQAQRFAVDKLSDLLGPAGDDLCDYIQATGSEQEFRAAVRRTEAILRELVGPELATQFSRDVETLRPR
jgi:hypothetical protein